MRAESDLELIVRLDPPGGLRVSVTDLVDRIRHAAVPIVVWIAPQGARAAGAGVFVAEAAPVLAMGPGTTLGPVVPVTLDGTTDPAAAAAYLASIASTGAAFSRHDGLDSSPSDLQ